MIRACRSGSCKEPWTLHPYNSKVRGGRVFAGPGLHSPRVDSSSTYVYMGYLPWILLTAAFPTKTDMYKHTRANHVHHHRARHHISHLSPVPAAAGARPPGVQGPSASKPILAGVGGFELDPHADIDTPVPVIAATAATVSGSAALAARTPSAAGVPTPEKPPPILPWPSASVRCRPPPLLPELDKTSFVVDGGGDQLLDAEDLRPPPLPLAAAAGLGPAAGTAVFSARRASSDRGAVALVASLVFCCCCCCGCARRSISRHS